MKKVFESLFNFLLMGLVVSLAIMTLFLGFDNSLNPDLYDC